jgi:hypothetical protein
VETLIDKIMVFPGDRLEINWKIADFATVGQEESAVILTDCCGFSLPKSYIEQYAQKQRLKRLVFLRFNFCSLLAISVFG